MKNRKSDSVGRSRSARSIVAPSTAPPKPTGSAAVGDIEMVRERTRGRIALAVIALLALVVLSGVIGLASGKLSVNDVKELVASQTALITLVGTSMASCAKSQLSGSARHPRGLSLLVAPMWIISRATMSPRWAPRLCDFLVLWMAGWLHSRQLEVIDFLREETRVLREQLGGRRPRFTDDQRRRLAVKGRPSDVAG